MQCKIFICVLLECNSFKMVSSQIMIIIVFSGYMDNVIDNKACRSLSATGTSFDYYLCKLYQTSLLLLIALLLHFTICFIIFYNC